MREKKNEVLARVRSQLEVGDNIKISKLIIKDIYVSAKEASEKLREEESCSCCEDETASRCCKMKKATL